MMKVLIVSHNPFSKISNNGKTLESIFRDFKKEELIQLYFVEDEDIDTEYASSYFKITDKDLILGTKNKKNVRNDFSENISTQKSENIIISYLRKQKHNIALFRDYFWDFLNIKANAEMHKWIKQQSPDFIFFVGGNQVFPHNIVSYISKKYYLKSAVYFTDDYIFSTQKNNFLQKIHHKKLHKTYQKTISNVELCFGISDMMCQIYSKYYRKQFFPIMNSIKTNIYDELEKAVNMSEQEIIVSYFGGLHLNRDKMIIRLGELFSKIKLKKIVIHLYTPSEINTRLRITFQENNVIIKDKVQGKELYQQIINTDILLHTESDDPFNRALTQLSVSTKIPEYLLSKNLVLAYGPTDVASINLLAENNLALIINSEDSEEVNIKKLLEIIDNKENQDYLINNAYQYALTKFDEEEISTNFRKAIENEIK